MAKYTTEVRSICETFAGYDERQGYSSVSEIISKSREKIFNFSYPIFDEAYRSVLETKILKHYYGREIGAETVGRWLLWLDTKMNEIMPYYNKLYEIDAIKFNPIYDTDYYKEGTRDGAKNEGSNSQSQSNTNSELNSTSIGTNNGGDKHTGTVSENESNVPKKETWDEFSDTPQGELNGVRTLNYLTTARHITEDGTGSSRNETTTYNDGVTRSENHEDNTRTNGTTVTSNTQNTTGTANTTEEYLEHIYGKMYPGSYSKQIVEYRESLLNIDMLIINELKNLFMMLW